MQSLEIKQYQIIHRRLLSVTNQYRLESIMHSFDDYYYLTLDGLGIANLPYLTVEADIASGRLVQFCPTGVPILEAYSWSMLHVKDNVWSWRN